MAQTTLFGDVPKTGKSEGIMPLAGRMRPRDLDEFVGQGHLLGEGRILRNMIEQDKVPSMIFWGPPGVGKTTLAGIIANRTKAEFVSFCSDGRDQGGQGDHVLRREEKAVRKEDGALR